MKEIKVSLAAPSEEDTCKAAIRKYGPNHQMIKLVEEMSELQKEICKYAQNMDNMEALAEECADVEICIAQLKMIFGFAERVSEYKELKLQRLREKMGMAPVKAKAREKIEQSGKTGLFDRTPGMEIV